MQLQLSRAATAVTALLSLLLLPLTSAAGAFPVHDEAVALFQTSVTVNKAERVVGVTGSCDASDPWGCDEEDGVADVDDASALYQTTVHVSGLEEEPRVLADFDAFTL